MIIKEHNIIYYVFFKGTLYLFWNDERHTRRVLRNGQGEQKTNLTQLNNVRSIPSLSFKAGTRLQVEFGVTG